MHAARCTQHPASVLLAVGMLLACGAAPAVVHCGLLSFLGPEATTKCLFCSNTFAIEPSFPALPSGHRKKRLPTATATTVSLGEPLAVFYMSHACAWSAAVSPAGG
jgi:hypothetical protein